MLKLYIVRHGQTQWNIEKRMQGWKDSDLTSNGIEAAIALGKRLKDVEFKCIYSSTSYRTIHTAELIRGDRDINIIPDENLREIGLGDWEGKAQEELIKIDGQRFKAFWETPHLYQRESGENFFQVRNRAQAVLQKILEENTDGNILIVSHGVFIKTILSIFKSLPIEQLWNQPFIHGTGLSIVEVCDESAKIILEGDISHIEAC